MQAGTIFDTAATVGAARQFWMPSVMVSGQGHAALGFSTAGTPFHADAATVGRLTSDPASTTRTVEIYTSSSAAYNPLDSGNNPINRWGDYSFTSLDPLDDMTLWTIQEFCDSTNSDGVRIVRLIAPAPATPSSTDHPGGVPANSVTYNNPTSITLDLNTTLASTGPRNVTVCNPDVQCATGFGLLTITGGPTPTPAPTPSPVQFFSITPCRIVANETDEDAARAE